MLPNSTISQTFSYQDMRRGLKRKLFFVFVCVFLTLFAFVVFTDHGFSRALEEPEELKELRLNYSKLVNESCSSSKNAGLPVIYVITPTYARPVQKAELTRLSHTLRLVPALHWVIVEDSDKPSSLVKKLVVASGLPHTVLTAPTPKEWKVKEKNQHWKKPRGVLQRNKALLWVRTNVKPEDKAVIYFADDDNVYSIELFEEMRWTKRVSIWPVGLVGGMMVERPLVDAKTGLVTGWNAAWQPKRPFPIDMAGFAVSASLLLSRPKAKFSLFAKSGFQESHLLQALVTQKELEPKADRCTKVYVWHTRTETPKFITVKGRNQKVLDLDVGIEV